MSLRAALDLIAGFLREAGYGLTLRALCEDSGCADLMTSVSCPGGELLRILDNAQATQALVAAAAAKAAAPAGPDAKAVFDEMALAALTRGAATTDEQAAALLEGIAPVVLEEAHGPANIICAHLHNGVLLTAGADGGLQVAQVDDDGAQDKQPRVISVSRAPLLCLAVHPAVPNLAAVGDMSGSTYLVQVDTGDVHAMGRNHAKYVVRAGWSPDGVFLATASYDKTVQLSRLDAHATPPTLTLVKTFHMRGAVEAIAFTPPGVEPAQLFFTGRDDHRVHVVTLSSLDSVPASINMNEFGDDHVSFTGMSLAVSPCAQYLLVATDKNRLLLFHRASGLLLRSYYGAENDGFSQPCCAFHPAGGHIFSTSQNHAVMVWSLVTQRQIATLKGHTAVIRSLSFDERDRLVTAGFDRTVRVWGDVADLRLFCTGSDSDSDEATSADPHA